MGNQELKIKREYSAGGLIFRDEPEGRLWLVVRPSGDGRWRLPKGRIEAGETSAQAAQREVREEGGIEAEVLDKIKNISFFFVRDGQRIYKTVTFYLMRYIQEAREGFSFETEAVDWLTYDEARKKLAFDNEKEILDKGKQILERGNIIS